MALQCRVLQAAVQVSVRGISCSPVHWSEWAAAPRQPTQKPCRQLCESCSRNLASQARDLERRTGIRLDRTERVANSLGKLAGVVTRLNQELQHDVKVRTRSRP